MGGRRTDGNISKYRTSCPTEAAAQKRITNQEGRRTLRFSFVSVEFRITSFHHGNDVRAGFAGSVLRPSENVAPAKRYRDSRLLDGRRLLPTLLENSHQDVTFQTVVFELVTLRVRHVLSKKGYGKKLLYVT